MQLVSRQLNLNPTYTTPPHLPSCLPGPPAPPSFLLWCRTRSGDPDNMKPAESLEDQQTHTHIVLDVQTGLPIEEQGAEEETESSMRISRWHGSGPRAIWPCRGCIPFPIPPGLCGAQTERAATHTQMHSHTANRTHTAHLPPAQRTRFSFSRLFLWPTLSVLCFFLSHYLCLLLPSLFQYPLSFSSLHMQSASLRSPHLPPPPLFSLPPSIPLPHAASPSISSPLSLFSVCVQSERPLSEPQHARRMEWSVQ